VANAADGLIFARMPPRVPKLSIRQILKWADLHKQYSGRWPISRSGPILGDEAGRSWEAINTALRKGGSGLRGGTTLAQLLERHRNVRDTRRTLPDVTRDQILKWVDLHHLRTGQWPSRDSGTILDRPDISWNTIDRYLRKGGIHFPGGSSLAHLLRDTRGIWDSRGNRRLTPSLILKWADAHYDRTGRWPVTLSGPVHVKPDENWAAIDMALRHGRRGLQGGTSLSRILQEKYGDRYRRNVGRRRAARG
jgi:hypothetical protein